MEKEIVVLSLFDGCACGYQALKEAGIKVKKYYASEIDPFAIKVAKKNHPDIIHLGDVQEWHNWIIDTPDLIIGGSPCQGFSFAGKKLNFDDPRSKLFFVYVAIVDHYKKLNPELLFLMENVKMEEKPKAIISQFLGVKPVLINSALVSAQNRERLYWSNIKTVREGLFGDLVTDIPQPKNLKIVIRDILEDDSTPVVNYAGRLVKRSNKSTAIDVNYWKGPDNKYQRTYCIGAMRGRYKVDGKRQDGKMKVAGMTQQELELRKDEKSNSLTTVQKDNLVVETPIQIGEADIEGHDFLKRVYSPEGKSPTLTAICGGNQERKISTDNYTWRKLTPLECERLQTMPDGYTEGVSNSQRYRMIGNGWTIKVISHIFSFMEIK